jgi:methyl coenzyme M reductase beta subunit
MITLLILRLLAIVFLCWLYLRQHSENRRLRQVAELWKTLALATEVQLECIQDFYTTVNVEGCMTRMRRREKDIEQYDNAEALALDTKEALIESGEYEE